MTHLETVEALMKLEKQLDIMNFKVISLEEQIQILKQTIHNLIEVSKNVQP